MINIFCVVTKESKQSVSGGKRCHKSYLENDMDPDCYSFMYFHSVFAKNIREAAREHRLFLKYEPNYRSSITDFDRKIAPARRIANGITHYLLYKLCYASKDPFIIVEHDAVFVNNELPDESDIPFDGSIIQISSHRDGQLSSDNIIECCRSNKMKQHDPSGWEKMKESIDLNDYYPYNEDEYMTIRQHPLKSLNGTSGYLITPIAAKKMIDYIENHGVAFGDRVREEHTGNNTIFLQTPQSIITKPLL